MVNVNPESQFGAGGRSDGVKLQKEFQTVVPATGYCALHGILSKLSSAMTADGTMNPATVTIDAMIVNLQTLANVDRVIEKW